jgi:hypothetical protein
MAEQQPMPLLADAVVMFLLPSVQLKAPMLTASAAL